MATPAARRKRPEGATEWIEHAEAIVAEDERGEIRIQGRGRIVRSEVRGYLSERLATRLRQALRNGALNEGRVVAFHHWKAMTGYDPAARTLLSKTLEEGRDHFDKTHILLGSSLVGMGVSIGATLLGHAVQCHTNDQTWKEALAAAHKEI
jgi:hypothetical protein